MALSTTLKNKMLAVYDLEYLPSVEIKNEDGTWIDFSDRVDIKSIAQLRLSTDKIPNKLVSSISVIILDNKDNYFNAMDDPAHATTVATFGTLASKFSNGFRNKDVRLGLKMKLDDDTWETAYLGIYRIKDIPTIDEVSQTARLKLAPDVDFLKTIGTETISHGKSQHLNKPVSYLVPEILKKVYPAGIGSSFDLPNRIYLETFDGEPTFSHYGKPPEYDGDTGRWRDDITKKPTAFYYNGIDFYFGIENELWKFTVSTETYDYIGSFTDSDMYARFIYPIATGYLYVLGVKKSHSSRYDTGRSGFINISTASFTQNLPGYNLDLFTGDFVWRETMGVGALNTESMFGNIRECPGVAEAMLGVNMPVPIPQCVHFAQNDTPYDKWIGFDPEGSLQGAPAVGDYEEFTSTQYVKKTFAESGYLTFLLEGFSGYPDRPGCQVYWGMKPAVHFADTETWGKLIFAVQSDGDPAGVRNSGGTAWIEVCYNKEGWHQQCSTVVQAAEEAHIYGLFYHYTGLDYLYYFIVNWIEDYDSTDPLSSTPPIWYIKAGRLTDNSGLPKLDNAHRYTLWTSGDDHFDSDDSLYAPISFIEFYITISTVDYLRTVVVMLDMDDIGGTCYKLYVYESLTGTLTPIAESYYGWSNFIYKSSLQKVFFIERDTGRVCRLDFPTIAIPTAYEVIGEGFEPVSQSLWECPNEAGLIIEVDGSDYSIYGIQYPSLPGYTQEDDVWPAGKYYFWKYHTEITDRVELFDMDRDNAYDALGHLAEAVDYMIGVNPDGTGFFDKKPTSSDSSQFTVDLDSSIGRHFTLSKGQGYEDIVNRSVFIPHEATAGDPEATLDLIGRIGSGGNQEYFNGQTEVKSDTIVEKNVILHCIKAGHVGTAVFKYRVYEFQISTALREDVAGGDLDLIRLDSNQDVAVDMLVQVANYEGAAEAMHVDVIEADGDIDLSEDLNEAYEKGTAVIFREAAHGIWSTEYDTPDDFTAETTWKEIGSTGLYLKFSADDDAPAPFCIGDRITIHNPGLELKKSRTKKYQSENKTSIDAYGLKERNFDNPYMSISLGMERVDIMIDDEDNPRHNWKLDSPLFLQARPYVVITIKGKRALPTATNNEEKVYIRQVSHDFSRGRSVLTLRSLADY